LTDTNIRNNLINSHFPAVISSFQVVLFRLLLALYVAPLLTFLS